MKVFPSGWASEETSLGRRSEVPVFNGDICVSEKKGLTLECADPSSLSVFSGLLPLDKWVGEEVKIVRRIEDSKIVFCPGHGMSDDRGQICVIEFSSGVKSELIIEGNNVVDPFEHEADMDLLVKAGMFTEADRSERDGEIRRNAELSKRSRQLEAQRAELQLSLTDTSWSQGRATYRQISRIEADLEALKEQLDRKNFRWVGYSLDFDYLTRYIPNLVDLFDIRNGSRYGGRNTDQMLSPSRKKIMAVHKVYDSSKSEHQQLGPGDAYVLQFEDGTFSAPFAPCRSTRWLSFPLTGLANAGLINLADLTQLRARAAICVGREDAKQVNAQRISELRNSLKSRGLGYRKTRDIVRELATLKS